MMVESKEQRNKLLQDCDHEFDLAFEMCLYEHEDTLLVLAARRRMLGSHGQLSQPSSQGSSCFHCPHRPTLEGCGVPQQ